jgi:hypothetical protein
MKRRLSQLTIGLYLAALSWGVFAHAVSFGVGAHPTMYFIVWDMFCGWSAFESRLHIVGEGVSGKYYELSPGPWGDIVPYGDAGRRHYDIVGAHVGRIAMNALKHTEHEPMSRIVVVEECWPKKYNMPEHVWDQRFDEPKDFHSYYQLRSVLAPNGQVMSMHSNWIARQMQMSVGANPRLMAAARKNQPFFAVDALRSFDFTTQVPGDDGLAPTPASPLGE